MDKIAEAGKYPSEQGTSISRQYVPSGPFKIIPAHSLLKRYFPWLISEWRNHFKPQSLKGIQCPLCGAAYQDVARSPRPALYLGRIVLPVVDHVAPIEDTVDKDVTV